jgi:hypothetical protein
MVTKTDKVLTSTEKTNRSCFTMFTKWQKSPGVLEAAAKDKTVTHYIKACIDGYPRQTKIKPSLLNARVRGIKNHCEANKIVDITDAAIKVAQGMITAYRAHLASKTKGVATTTPAAVKTETKAAETKTVPQAKAETKVAKTTAPTLATKAPVTKTKPTVTQPRV